MSATTNTNTNNKRRLKDIDTGEDVARTQDRTATQKVFKSSPITDRSSTFIAHFHPHDNDGHQSGNASKSTTQTIKTLQNDPAFASADHRMAAWRRASTQRTLLGAMSGSGSGPGPGLGFGSATVRTSGGVTYTTNSDDDGEKYAGKRLEKVLNELDVQGTVVVARWYGGVLLGPVRFAHIENVAREAIGNWRRSVGDGIGIGIGGKRVKVGGVVGLLSSSSSPAGVGVSSSPGPGSVSKEMTDAQRKVDEETRVRLAEQLVRRDESIVVLRALLAEKKEEQQQRKDEEDKRMIEAASSAIPASNPAPDSIHQNGEGDVTAPQPSSLPDTTPFSSSAPREPAPDSASKDTSTSTSASVTTTANMASSPPLQATPTATPTTPTTKPQPQPMDYAQMPLSRLRQLEKARDATIAFILKQIDKAEAEAKAKREGEGS
ncbi:hypothetical protein LTR84_003060 [Exophiala bonariae]|uniref:Impact N-terminal domain-containing protein n=1 Tax=Exophiala bonariae TaxID=1690606 RepID=A0AAV9N7L3_9EURO|nr:hypothetical protein LTR84_003060 [Exophiala bonariae]